MHSTPVVAKRLGIPVDSVYGSGGVNDPVAYVDSEALERTLGAELVGASVDVSSAPATISCPRHCTLAACAHHSRRGAPSPHFTRTAQSRRGATPVMAAAVQLLVPLFMLLLMVFCFASVVLLRYLKVAAVDRHKIDLVAQVCLTVASKLNERMYVPLGRSDGTKEEHDAKEAMDKMRRRRPRPGRRSCARKPRARPCCQPSTAR